MQFKMFTCKNKFFALIFILKLSWKNAPNSCRIFLSINNQVKYTKKHLHTNVILNLLILYMIVSNINNNNNFIKQKTEKYFKRKPMIY